MVDACPYERAPPQFDSDRDGCVDDGDGDGVADDNDLCPEEAWEYMDANGDGCDDVSQWFLMITPIDACYSAYTYGTSCSMWIRSIEVTVDERTIHQESGSILVLSNSVGATDRSWVYVFDKSQDASIENATKIELELEILFWHSSLQTTQGRQFGSWPGTWDPYPSYTPPLVYWDYQVEFQKGMLSENREEERVVTVSNRQYSASASFQTHSFGWSYQSISDVDGDGYSVPGATYDGPCLNYACSVNFHNVEDAFPNDATQWSDSDGDGYGDNASGYRGDLFPDDPYEWADDDGDGYGDNSDACPSVYGTSSWYDRSGCPDLDEDGFADEDEVCPGEYGTSPYWLELGCPDPDGDGYADNFSDVCPGVYGTAYRYEMWGCPDTDLDGWADPGSAGASPLDPGIDRCPDRYGTAFQGEYIGCRDTDGDGWADVEDDLPNDGEYWVDSDGDGVADEEDLFAHNRLISHEGHVAALMFLGVFVACVAGLLFLRRHRAAEEAMAEELTAWLDGFRGPSTEQQNDEYESPTPYEPKMF